MNIKKDLIRRTKEELENVRKIRNTCESDLIRIATNRNLPCASCELAYKSIARNKPDKLDIAFANSLYVQIVKYNALAKALQHELNTLCKKQDERNQLWSKIDKIATYIYKHKEMDECTKNIMNESQASFARDIIELTESYAKDKINLIDIHFSTSLAGCEPHKRACSITYSVNYNDNLSTRNVLTRK